MVDLDFKEQVRARLDIVSLVSEYVSLSKRGHNHFGCCPFHQEKTPSFCVNGEKGFFHCFGCGKSGDAFEFYMQIEGVGFADALKDLAAKVGLELPGGESLTPAEVALRKKKELAASLLERAKNFYVKNLSTPLGQRVCDYLRRRGFSQGTWEKFELGYAGDRTELVNELKLSSEEEIQLALELGLMGRSEQGELYNPFAMRLMIPIRDAFGRMIGFGGRALTSGNAAKYLNSPQSFLFDKGHNLYAFNFSKTEAIKRQEILLVEGYMDVMACFQMGYPVAVAALGTAITANHVEMISKLKCRVQLGLDSDSSGVHAMFHAAELFLPQVSNVTVVRWPAKDPGELLGSPALFAGAIKNAKHVCAHAIDLATATLDGSIERVVAAVEMVGPLLDGLPAGLQRDLYLAMTAEKLHLSGEQLAKALQDSRDKRRRESRNKKVEAAKNGPANGQNSQPPPPPAKPRPPNLLEMQVVKEIIARRNLWCYIGELVPQLSDERLGCFLTEIANKEALPSEDEAVVILGDTVLAKQLLAETDVRDDTSGGQDQDDKVLIDLQYSLQEYNLKRDLSELQMAIDSAQKAGDEAAVADLLLQKKELRVRFQQIKEARRS